MLARTLRRFDGADVLKRTGRTYVVLVTLGLLSWLPYGHAEEPRVGVGDSRAGYDRSDFRTDSRQLPFAGVAPTRTGFPERQDLLGLPGPPSGFSGSTDEVALGRKLFFDRRLSFNGVLSCGMCHVPEQGFAQNELATPVGTEGRAVKRNAPSLYNVGYRPRLFHDGREGTLERQVWAPLLASNEMANPSIGSVLERLEGLPEYRAMFEQAYGRGPGMETLGRALASYERTLNSAYSAFDRFHFSNEAQAMGQSAQLGWDVFQREGCIACHVVSDDHAQFTDELFHDTGIGYLNSQSLNSEVKSTTRVLIAPGVEVEVLSARKMNDLGRYEATGRSSDRWKYRTPTLRNVAVTAPYMHDGSLATLDDVLDYYIAGGVAHEGQDARIRPLRLNAEERAGLLAFLNALTGANIEELAADARSATIGDY